MWKNNLKKVDSFSALLPDRGTGTKFVILLSAVKTPFENLALSNETSSRHPEAIVRTDIAHY